MRGKGQLLIATDLSSLMEHRCCFPTPPLPSPSFLRGCEAENPSLPTKNFSCGILLNNSGLLWLLVLICGRTIHHKPPKCVKIVLNIEWKPQQNYQNTIILPQQKILGRAAPSTSCWKELGKGKRVGWWIIIEENNTKDHWAQCIEKKVRHGHSLWT